MKRDFILNRIIKVMLLVLSMTVGQNALAESTWEVTNENGNSNTFTIKRSEKGYEQTVHFRTISLSAYAGQHFTAVDMDYTFPANEDTKTVTVSESTPSGAYAYQTATSRKYGFEVTDRGGFQLAYAERSKTWGTSVTGSGVFSEKDVTIHSGEVTVTDGGYAQSSNPYTINSSSYYNAGTQAYLSFLDAQLRMTLNFQAKEKSDGYQYVQILVNNTTDCDTGAGDGNPGTIRLSRYMAGFTIGGKGVDTYYNYSFPVTTVGNDAGATKPWTGINNTVADLEKQKFNTDCRATDGKLIIPTNFTTLVVRLNASGSDNDDWYAKNIKANIIAVDATAPTKSAVSVNPGRHAKGNTVYVSVAFSEIVTVAGTPTLTTTSDNHWGSLSYVTGSGTNVLTFSTTIPQDATGNLNVTGYSGTITDLAGNSPSSGSVTASSLCSLDDDLAYTLSDFQQEDGNYLITCHDDLRGLAGYVSGGNNCSGLTFRQVADIAFAHTTNWNNSSSTENNFTAIGDYDHPFQGTYDGDGHTISGIRIYKGGTSNSDYQGLFGVVKNNGTVKRVTLSDARITGYREVGGIAAHTFFCTIEDCTVDANVCIHAVQSNTYDHGGIVGYNQAGPVNRCISRASLTVANASGCHEFGGIVGRNNSNTITDCIAEGVVIPDVKGRGAIVGYKRNGTLTRNYYRGCTVAGVANATGVGQGTSESSTETSDPAGARALYALSLLANTVIDRTPSATLPGSGNKTYTTGADIEGYTYVIATSNLRLSYNSATLSEGYTVRLTATETSGGAPVALTDRGNYTYDLTMPSADVTVTAEVVPVISYIDANGDEQTCVGPTPIVAGTAEYGNSGTAEAWYYVSGDVTISGTKGVQFLDQQVNIILCDGATLTSNASGSGIIGLDAKNGSLVIYAQSGGSGSIVATATDNSAIFAKLGMDVNGGVISATTTGVYGIRTESNGLHHDYGPVTIRRGSITAQGTTRGIFAGSSITILGGTVSATATRTDAGSGLTAWYGDVSILGGNVTASGYYGIVTQAVGRTVTLGWSSPDDRITASSYACSTLAVKAGQAFYDGADYYTGTLSTDQINAMAGKTLLPAVTYIDENGQEQSKNLSDVTIIESSDGNVELGNNNVERWYAVSGNVTINGQLNFIDKNIHLILCDGASLTVNCATMHAICTPLGDLTIYGQSAQSGTITATTNGNGSYGIYGSHNITINGGTVNATSNSASAILSPEDVIINGGTVTASGYYGINATGNVIINGGTVTAHCSNNYYAIYGYNNVTINGGIINADSPNNAIYAEGGNITLGWSDASDRITASSYGTRNGTIQVKAGQAFYDGNDYYTGTLSTDQINAMAGKTLQPAVTYSITLPEHVSASGTVTRLNGTTYAPAGATVTLSTETGIILSSVTVNGTPATDNGDGTWSFIMPAQDVTVAATVTTPVTYIDADGTEQSCTNYTLLTSYDDISNATNNQGCLPGGWYVVDGDIFFPYLQFSGDVHIILADGARLDAYDAIDCYGYDLTIYGQAAGSGELSVNNSIYFNNICINGGTINNYNGTYGIQANGNVTINGGTINIENSNNAGIQAYGNVTINGGTINIENSNNAGILAYGNVTINGGTINIENSNNASIQADGNVTINGGTLSINSNFDIWDSNVILGTSTSLKTLNIINGIYVYKISLDRTFTVGKPATVMLPFYMDVNKISGGTFYTFGGVEKENDRWVATMNAVTDYIEPNTPYLVMPTETSLTFNNETLLCTNGGGGGQTADEGSHWTFKGTYDYIKWTTDTSDPDYTAERAAEIGRVYGFAGVQKDGIEVGDFVKVASGARIRPMSAYLMWSDTPNAQNAPMRGSSRTGSAQELPQSITVRLLDASGTVTNVGEIDTVTGEISFEGWYTLQGVKLDAEPTEPGIYINNGKTVSIQK